MHKCSCCPIEVRNLFAVAHNVVVNNAGRDTLQRLKEVVEFYQPLMDAHFQALRDEDPVVLRAEINALEKQVEELKQKSK